MADITEKTTETTQKAQEKSLAEISKALREKPFFDVLSEMRYIDWCRLSRAVEAEFRGLSNQQVLDEKHANRAIHQAGEVF